MRACFCLLIPLLLVVIALLQCATATEKAQTNSSKGGGAKAKDAQPKASTHADTKKPSEKADHSKKETEKDGVQNAPPAAGKEHAGKPVHGHDKKQHEKKGSRSTSPHGKRDPSPSRSGNRDNHGADGHTGKVGHDHGHGHESPEDKNKKKGTSHSSGGGSSPTVGSPRADGSKKVQPTENGKHHQAEKQKDRHQPPSPTAAATAGHNRHVGPHKSGNGVAPPPPAVEKQAAPTFEAPSVPSPGDDGDNGGGFGGLEPSSGGGSQFGDELDDLPTGAGAEMDFGQDGVNDSPMPNSRARRTSLGDADEPAERAQVGFGDDADGGDVAAAGDGMNKMDNYGLDDDDAKSEGADADPFDKEAGGPQEDGNEADQFKDPSENADDDGLMMKKKGEVAMDD